MKRHYTLSTVASSWASRLWGNYVNSGQSHAPNGHLRNFYGPTLNQGQLGSCSAFAGTQFDAALLRMGGAPEFHGSELADYYEERVLNGTINSDSGATLAECIQVLEQYGMMPESDDPYVIAKYTVDPPNDWVPSTRLKESQVWYVHSAVDAVDALATGHPILAGILVFSEMESAECAATGVVPMPANPNQVLGGHMINIIGYDDRAQMFLCLNQWGSDWGVKDGGFQGCFWLPYTYWSYVIDAVAGVSSNGVPKLPQPLFIHPANVG